MFKCFALLADVHVDEDYQHMRGLRIRAEDLRVDLFCFHVPVNHPHAFCEVEFFVALVGIALSLLSFAKCTCIVGSKAAKVLMCIASPEPVASQIIDHCSGRAHYS